jgi:alpha-1,3-rhamnosyltransferase
MAETSKASVIIPAFNHESYVEEAVRSVVDQIYPDVELVAIDDASTDRTPEILERLSQELGFQLLRNEKNLGLNATLERGLGASTGAFLSVLASDDVILPHKIEREVGFLQETGKDGVYANGNLLMPDGSQVAIDLSDIARRFVDGSILPHVYLQDTRAPLLQSGLFRREALLAMCAVRRQFKSDDWVTLIKLLESFDIGFIDEPMFLYRQHERNEHRNYWATLPMRMDVIARAVPEPLRVEALANLLASQATYLLSDGKGWAALQLKLASIAMYPSPRRLVKFARRRWARAKAKLRE